MGVEMAIEVLARFRPRELSRRLLREGMTAREFSSELLEKKMPVDAIEFVAHMLPVHVAIWWGCLCLHHAAGMSLSAVERAAVTAAIQYLYQPGEEQRVLAQAQIEAAGRTSPSGALALAVSLTGGS